MQCLILEKLDGISLNLTYQDGKLESAVTRGDGTQGDDITLNATHIRGVLKTIPFQGRVQIRGEVVLPLKEFNEYWAPKGKANPRNAVSGLCKGRSTPEDLATMQFVAYDLYGTERMPAVTEAAVILKLVQAGFTVPVISRVVNSAQEAEEFYRLYDTTLRKELPWQTDGLVIRINDLATQEAKFSIEGGRPTYAVAIKPSPAAVVTTVKKVTWSMGLSGRFCPVAEVEPTAFDGTTLRNVNLHNLENVQNLHKQGFGIGAQILVVRAGDVIPYLSRIVTPAPKA